jgi:hypothetical protein
MVILTFVASLTQLLSKSIAVEFGVIGEIKLPELHEPSLTPF